MLDGVPLATGAPPTRLRPRAPARPLRGERRRPAEGAASCSPARATRCGRPACSTCRPWSTSGWARSSPRPRRSRASARSRPPSATWAGVAVAEHNTGWLAFLRGDLPRALEQYAAAAAFFDALRHRPASTSSSTRWLPTCPAGSPRTPSPSSSPHSSPDRCSRARRRTSWWRSPVRHWPRATGTVPCRPPTRARRCCAHSPGTSTGWRPTSSRSPRGTAPVSRPPPCCAGPSASSRGCARLVRPSCRRLSSSVQVSRAGSGPLARPGSRPSWLAEAASYRRATTGSERALGWLAQARARDAGR